MMTARTNPRSPSRAACAALIAAIAVFCAAHVWLNFRWLNDIAYVPGYDIGLFGQALWRLGRDGRPWATVYVPGGPYNVLGEHFMPVLFLIAPFYWLHPHPATLVVINVAAVAAGAAPVFGLARRWFKSDILALAAALLYLASPFPNLAACNLFIPEMARAALYLAAVWALESERPRLHWLFLALAVCCRETAGLEIASIGLLEAAFLGRRRDGVLLMILGTAWFAACLHWIEPWLGFHNPLSALYASPTGAHVGVSAVVRRFIGRPDALYAWLGSPERVKLVFKLFLSCGFLSLLAPEWLIPSAAPLLLILVLTNRDLTSDWTPWYVFPAFPFFFLSALKALTKPRIPIRAGLAWLCAGGFAAYALVDPGIGRQCLFLLKPHDAPDRSLALRRVLPLIADSDSVSVSEGLMPFVCNRMELYTFPDRWRDADKVFVDRFTLAGKPSVPTALALAREAVVGRSEAAERTRRAARGDRALAGFPTRSSSGVYSDVLDELMNDGSFDLVFQDEDILLFRRKTGARASP
jgi:uncharacterized membrane protein